MTKRQAIVTGAFSQRMNLRLDDQTRVTARIKGKKLRPVCGDNVEVEAIPNEADWLITAIGERRNELSRPDRRGRREVLAANIDSLVVVAAVEPRADWFIVDRYLAAAESMGAGAIVVYNKTDLAEPGDSHADALSDYLRCGYPVLTCSAQSGANLDQLKALLSHQTAIIVGQSGVGKSSIINNLINGSEQRTAAISGSTGEGKHTTVNSVMIDLPGGGAIIDSPGVRDFAPSIEHTPDVIHGFRDIAEAGQHCRFANCSHLREPNCAVKLAVDSGDISERRYESYKRLHNLTRDLAGKRIQTNP